MGQRNKRSGSHERVVDHEMRGQELIRAKRELAAYFKGRRTEREARAALKVIKAFVRDRERLDPKNRPVIPGVRPAKVAKNAARLEAESGGSKRRRRKSGRKPHNASPRAAVVSIESQMSSRGGQSDASDDERIP